MRELMLGNISVSLGKCGQLCVLPAALQQHPGHGPAFLQVGLKALYFVFLFQNRIVLYLYSALLLPDGALLFHDGAALLLDDILLLPCVSLQVLGNAVEHGGLPFFLPQFQTGVQKCQQGGRQPRSQYALNDKVPIHTAKVGKSIHLQWTPQGCGERPCG